MFSLCGNFRWLVACIHICFCSVCVSVCLCAHVHTRVCLYVAICLSVYMCVYVGVCSIHVHVWVRWIQILLCTDVLMDTSLTSTLCNSNSVCQLNYPLATENAIYNFKALLTFEHLLYVVTSTVFSFRVFTTLFRTELMIYKLTVKRLKNK